MKAVIQRVENAHVSIHNKIKSKINSGYVILLGIHKNDTFQDSEWIIKKLLNLRLFNDVSGKPNLNITEIKRDILVISQFTLIADCKKGTRPSYSNALNTKEAKELYNQFISTLQAQYARIKTGEFQEHMKVSLTNDGPITIILDSKNK
jgi:D-aminoacyl-tRNA deacylase